MQKFSFIVNHIISYQVLFHELSPPVPSHQKTPGARSAPRQMPEVSPRLLSGRDMQNQRSKHAVMKLLFQLACIIFAEIAVLGPS